MARDERPPQAPRRGRDLTSPRDLPPQCKLAAAFAFVVAVVATPRESVWAFGVYLALACVAAAAARLRPGAVLRRLAFELPFVVFALLLPLTGGGRETVAGLSVEGLWAGWNVLAKATLGALAVVVVSSTTPVAGVLRGLEALRMPRAFTSVAGFMARYAGVIGDEARRMRIAQQSRGYAPRWLWQARAAGSAAAALFVRSFERGERIYVAMLSRGYAGSLPAAALHRAGRADWVLALSLPLAAGAVAAASWT
ncbi:MAG TPA: cobalt ECF transporter T component CbiQ [Actinomycetota bacterium]|nr:cobalt ECF transporter T component CbiQ [Actinomycetota bacterium]